MQYKGGTLRPIWQIILLVPIYPFYWAADKFVSFMDQHV